MIFHIPFITVSQIGLTTQFLMSIAKIKKETTKK